MRFRLQAEWPREYTLAIALIAVFYCFAAGLITAAAFQILKPAQQSLETPK